jgi:hypothetical protein
MCADSSLSSHVGNQARKMGNTCATSIIDELYLSIFATAATALSVADDDSYIHACCHSSNNPAHA